MSETTSARGGAGAGFLANVNLVFLTSLVGYALAFVIALVLARALGPEGRGVTSLYQSAVNLGYALGGLGIATAVLYFLARGNQTPRQLLESALVVSLLAAVLTAVVALLAHLWFGERLSRDGLPYGFAVLAVPGAVQYRALQSVLHAQGRFAAMNLLDLLLEVVILGGFATLHFTTGLTIGRAVEVWSLAFLAPVLLGYGLVGAAAWPRRLPGLGELRRNLGFGIQGQLGNLVQLLNYRLDSYLVLILVSTSGVGLYTVGVQLSEGLWFIANSIAVVLLPNLTAGDAEYGARTMPLVCRSTLLVSAAAALGLGLVAPLAIPLVFGQDFRGSVLPFLILLPGSVALAGTKILAAYVFSRGRPLLNAGIALAALVVTVAADLVLIPLWEVKGAALGASLGYGLSLLLTALTYRRLAKASLRDALLPRAADLPLYYGALRHWLSRLRFGRRPAEELQP